MTETKPPKDSWRVHARASLKAHHRGLVWALEALGFLIAGFIILIAAAAYRLDRGPVEIKFLTPQLVAWLDHQLAPLQVKVVGAALRWSPADNELAVYATGVSVTDIAGAPIVSIPSIHFSLGFRALILGQLQPTAVTLESPSVHVQRGPSGNFYLRPGPAPEPGPSEPLPVVVAALANWVQRDHDSREKEGSPGRIYVHNGAIEIDDQRAARVWYVSGLALDLARAAPKYVLTGSSDIENGTDHAHLSITLDYNAVSRQSHYRVALSPVVPAHWAPLLPVVLARAVDLDLPMNATVSGGDDFATGAVDPIHFISEGQAGEILDPALDHGRYGIKRLHVSGSFDPAEDRLDLDHLNLDVGGPTAEAAIVVTHLGPATPALPTTIDLHLAIHDVPRQGMEGYWPPIPVPKTRAWVLGHVLAGELTDLTLHGLWEIHPELPQHVQKKLLDGAMRFEGVTLDYLHGLPPAVGLDATAKLSIDEIDFDAHAAKVLGLTLRHGTASIAGLANPDAASTMTVALDLAGPARDGIQFVSAPRLHVADKLGFTADAVSGTLAGPVQVSFPLPKSGDAKADAVQYRADLALNNIAIVKGVLGRDISNGDLALSVDQNHIVVSGKAAIDGAPSQFRWENSFDPRARIRSRLHLAGMVDDAARIRLGVDPLPGSVQGTVGVNADATIDRDRRTDALIHLDFLHSTVLLDDANWSKPPGMPGTLTMRADMLDGHWRHLRALDAHGPGLDVQGDIDFDDDGGIALARSQHLVIGDTDAAGEVAHGRDGWHVTLSGKAVDATGYILKFNVPTTEAEREKSPPVDVNITADRLVLGPGRVTGAVSFQGAFNHAALQSGDLKADIADDRHLTFHLDRPEDGGLIAASTDDFGDTTRILSVSDRVAGGSATLTGTCVRIDGTRHFKAQLEAQNYRLVRAPILAKLLSIASFTSMASLLNGEGVPFKRLSAELSLTDGFLAIEHWRADGNAIGLVGTGDYNFDTKTINLDGTLVPAYFLNGVLGDVPIVGGFLAGGNGGGLFGANFKVGGSVSSPNITANPLSLLAPGLLRDLFFFQAPRPGHARSPATGGAGSAQ